MEIEGSEGRRWGSGFQGVWGLRSGKLGVPGGEVRARGWVSRGFSLLASKRLAEDGRHS